MTRVTAPIAKLTRSLSTSASVPRPSKLVNNVSKAAASAARVRKELELNVDARSSDAPDSARHLTTATAHRPLPNPNRTNIPLMQTFFSTTPASRAQADTSTIDYAVLPSFAAAADEADSSSHPAVLRVPLLPDNFAPDRSRLAPEAEDPPLPTPQISIVAADPANVLPAALTEVEGMGVDGVELSFAHGEEETTASSAAPEGGMLKDLWKGLMDDVFGEEGGSTKAKPAM